MSKVCNMREAIAELVSDGSSVALGLQMEQMIPFAAGHEIIRQKKRGLRLIGPISDILFDQMIGAGCMEQVIAAWVGNVMMGSAYNFRRAVEQDGMKVFNMTNFTIALALQAGAMGVPFLPTNTALGSDVTRGNEFFAEIDSPFAGEQKPSGDGRPWSNPRGARQTEPITEKLLTVRALNPDVTIVHVQRADREGNAHCWGSFGVMLEGVRAAKRVIVVAEEIVEPEVIASDPNRTVVPGFLVNAVVECRYGAHPSPVQGYYKRDDAFFRQYHEQTKTKNDSDAWLERWVYGVADRAAYVNQLGACRCEGLAVKQHAYAAQTDFGY
ncbi:MAG: CoA transferase subunit A [Acidobacteria bacterium]|nr:MAG: CoA transferase subunit A [Acidobacteriota bacterium]